MSDQNQQLINQVKTYLEEHENLSFKITTTVRGYLELSTEQIRVLLDALCCYQSQDEEKMQLRDELLEVFFHKPKL